MGPLASSIGLGAGLGVIISVALAGVAPNDGIDWAKAQ
jgi:hypothetical protein